jgi:positive regulator of sigma E activity
MYGNVGRHMKETGIVVNLKSALATVKVTRPAASSGCCHFDTTKDEFLDAYNTCNAIINDRVSVESAEDTEKKQAFVQFGVYIAGFVLGLVGGNYAAGLFNRENLSELFSVTATLAAVVIIHIVYKRRSGNTVKKLPVINYIEQ